MPRDTALERITVSSNGVDFAALAAGREGSPLALCLHGFPDSAHTWRHLMPALADAGFRAVAPWMRGYHPTGPAADGRYQRGALTADVNALHDALDGDDRAVAIGHDWGALAIYGALAAEPTRWRRAVTVAIPPVPVSVAMFSSYEQLKRSFYVFVFQTQLAEGIVGADDLAFIDRLWADWSPGYDAGDDLPLVKESLRPPECLAAALGYYRAMLQPSLTDPELAELEGAAFQPNPVPTLYLHGTDDGCFQLDLAAVDPHLPEGSEVVEVPGTGHFLHLERPEEVNRTILGFLIRE